MAKLKRFTRYIIFPTTLIIWRLSYSFLPKPIQLLFLTTLGLWLFTTNLDILDKLKMEPLYLLDLPEYNLSNSYGLCVTMSILCCSSAWLYGFYQSKFIIIILYLFTFLFWIQPVKYYRQERKTIFKILTESLFSSHVLLRNVIFSDVLISFSGIISQTMLETYWLAFPKTKDEYKLRKNTFESWMDLIIPVIVAYFGFYLGSLI